MHHKERVLCQRQERQAHKEMKEPLLDELREG